MQRHICATGMFSPPRRFLPNHTILTYLPIYLPKFKYSHIQAEPPNSTNIPDKQTLSKLLTDTIALAFPSHQKQRIIWSRLASAAQQLPFLLAKLEDLLFPYESVPREGTVQHGDSVELPDEAVEIIGVLNTWAILGCEYSF